MKARTIVENIITNINELFVCINQRPVFVFGNAKSGTTIIAYLLSKSLCRSCTADIVRAIPDACLALQLEHKLLSIDKLVNKYKLEFSRGVIKEPVFTNYASDFISYFPDGKSIFVFRDPRDNIRSILNRLKIPGNLDDINLDEWPELKKTPAWKLALDDSWKKNRFGGCYIETMARNWMCAYEQYRINSNKVFLIRYEDFCKNKSLAIYRLCESMGLKVETDISSIVNIQKQSKGDSECNLIEFFGKRNLSMIENICKKGIHSLGYPASLKNY